MVSEFILCTHNLALNKTLLAQHKETLVTY